MLYIESLTVSYNSSHAVESLTVSCWNCSHAVNSH